jgi:hypothetical protein
LHLSLGLVRLGWDVRIITLDRMGDHWRVPDLAAVTALLNWASEKPDPSG